MSTRAQVCSFRLQHLSLVVVSSVLKTLPKGGKLLWKQARRRHLPSLLPESKRRIVRDLIAEWGKCCWFNSVIRISLLEVSANILLLPIPVNLTICSKLFAHPSVTVPRITFC
jgi:hypothetical protein